MTASRLAVAFLALTLPAALRTVPAQVTSTLDVGLRQWDGSAAPAGLAAAPALRVERESFRITASGAATIDGRQLRMLDGAADARLISPRLPRLGGIRGELSATLDRDPYDSVPGAAQVGISGRLRLDRPGYGLWASGGRTRSWTAARTPAATVSGAGVWRTVGEMTIGASLRHQSVERREGVVDDSASCRRRSASDTTPGLRGGCARGASATDVEASAEWGRRNVELLASGGSRLTFRGVGSGGARLWGAASGAVWLAPQVALVASVARQPTNVVRGFPDRTFATLGFRVRPRLLQTRAVPVGEARPAVTAFDVGPEVSGRRTLRVVAPRARAVEIRGDVTGWDPVVLVERGGGRWEVELALPPGLHQLMLRIDGGAWRPPPGLPTADDGFNGEVGVIVVGEEGGP
jgi:hypothetical protein